MLAGEFEDGDTVIVDVIEGEIKLRRGEDQSLEQEEILTAN
jgi:hypothetical protein